MASKFEPTREWLLECGATEEDLERCEAVGATYWLADSGDMWLAVGDQGEHLVGGMQVEVVESGPRQRVYREWKKEVPE